MTGGTERWEPQQLGSPRPPTTSLTLSRSFQTSAISRGIDAAAKIFGAGAAIAAAAGFGAVSGAVFGGLLIGYARNPSLKQLLFSCVILGFALLGTMGLLCLMAAFLPSSPCEGAISTPMVLFPSRRPCMSLFLYLPGQQGKVVGSGLDRRKTDKYSINKKKKKIKTVHQIPA